MALPELTQFIFLRELVDHLVLPAMSSRKPILNQQLPLSSLQFKSVSKENRK